MAEKGKIMKKISVILASVMILLTLMSVSVFADATVNVTINGEAMVSDQPGLIIEGRTMIPARAVFEKIGAEVYWDAYKTGGFVSVVMPSTSVVLYVSETDGDNYLLYNNVQKVGLDVPAVIRNGRTLVPLRAIGEVLNAEVNWNNDTRTASIDWTATESIDDNGETYKANEALTVEEATKKFAEKDATAKINPAPAYKNGARYFTALSVENQKKYTCDNTKNVAEEEYKIYGTINGNVIPYDQYSYYNKISNDEAMFKYGTSEFNEEQKKEIEESTKKKLFELRNVAEQAKKEGAVKDKNFYDAAAYYSQLITSGFPAETFCSILGLSLESFFEFTELYAYQNALIVKHVEEGKIDLSDKALTEEYASKYYMAKHILFKNTDENEEKLDAKKLAEKKKLAESTLKKIKTDEDFDKYMNELSEDPGSKAQPEGYIFTDGEMVAEFENAVKELEVGKVSKIVESSYGYHIIKRVELNKDPAEVANYASALQNSLIEKYFTNIIPEWEKANEIVIF